MVGYFQIASGCLYKEPSQPTDAGVAECFPDQHFDHSSFNLPMALPYLNLKYLFLINVIHVVCGKWVVNDTCASSGVSSLREV